MKNKTIYLLVGPKGSGKSYIGTFMNQHLGIPFLRVEDWVKKIKRKRRIDDSSYLKEVFETIETGVRDKLKHLDTITFESTGLTEHFDQMLKSLKHDFIVKIIRITAHQDLCLKRVKSRDQSIHINISDKEVQFINQMVNNKSIKTDFEIDTNDIGEKQLLAQVKTIIAK